MFGKERQDIGVLAILMCQTTVLIILYDVQRQIHNQKVVIQCAERIQEDRIMILMMDKYKSRAIPQNPH